MTLNFVTDCDEGIPEQRKVLWFVSFDKLTAGGEIWVQREECEDICEALNFRDRMLDKGFRAKVWWQYVY